VNFLCSVRVTILTLCFAMRAAELHVPPRLDQPVPKLSTSDIHGEQLALDERGVKFTLFLPQGWSTNCVTNAAITAHFHTVASSAIPSHVRRGSLDPLIVFALGSGSSAYRAPFEDTNRFGRILDLVEKQLRERGAECRITNVDISSFSAGYGAVRELVKSPQYFAIIRRVVLLDSIYGSLQAQPAGVTNRVADPAHADVWAPLARAAMKGDKTFVITLSDILPPNFASSLEVTSALLDHVGLKLEPTTFATNEFALISRVDAGNFHVWRYAGTNGPAHMAHVQHMADVWRAIERR
jgi:hypothetical protein